MSRARKHIDTLTAERDEFKKKLECEPCSKKVLELESEVSRLTLALSDPDLKTRRLFLAKITAERDEYKMEAGICTATNKLLKDGFNSVCDQRDELVFE